MSAPHQRSIGWMGLKRGHRAKPLEWLAERAIFLVSLTAILMVFLIFVFIGREALPVAFGQMNTAKVQKVLPAEQVTALARRAGGAAGAIRRSRSDRL